MNDKEKKLLGEELKRLRLKNNLTLEEVGNRLNVTHKSVQFWEQGKNEIKLSKLIELVRIYNTSIDDVLDKAGL